MFSSLPSSDALPGVSTGGDQTKPLFGANTFSAFGQLPVASATSETVRSAESSGVNSAASLATNSMFEASAIATTGSLNMFGNQLTDTNADKERLAFGSGGFGAPLTGTANILNSSGTAAATESKAEKGIFGAGAFGGLSLDAGSTAPTVEPVKNPFATQGFGTCSSVFSAWVIVCRKFRSFFFGFMISENHDRFVECLMSQIS